MRVSRDAWQGTRKRQIEKGRKTNSRGNGETSKSSKKWTAERRAG